MNELENEMKRIVKDMQESNLKYRKIIQAGVHKWVKDYQDGKIKIDTVGDLKKLIDLDIYLQKEDMILVKNNKRFFELKNK
ncbi:hypothetical protein [Rossellomorea marisflavi]|uniref:hypothetical protein n=1 Tax=Rossellomorea marisflavi TaxID=189381 RepID=UPI003D2F4FFA